MIEERLEVALRQTKLDWTLCFIGENQKEKLNELNANLKRSYDDAGNGKRIDSGFAYWGAGPSYEWSNACQDDIYVVMSASISHFPQRWRELKRKSSLSSMHYVSLG